MHPSKLFNRRSSSVSSLSLNSAQAKTIKTKANATVEAKSQSQKLKQLKMQIIGPMLIRKQMEMAAPEKEEVKTRHIIK